LIRPDTTGRTGSFRPVLGAAVLLFVAVLATAGVKSYRDLEAARQRRHLLETRIAQTQAEIARLHNRIEQLRGDPGALERLAREDLGMVRPGDVIIELPLVDPPPPKPGTILPSPASSSPAVVTPAVPAVAGTGAAKSPGAALPATAGAAAPLPAVEHP
jgi:cell division protein FtsB